MQRVLGKFVRRWLTVERNSNASHTASHVCRSLRMESLETRDLLATVLVTNGNDTGAGSFRAAAEAANFDPSITSIHFADDFMIQTESAIEYTGAQTLRIIGKNSMVEPSPTTTNDFDLFVSSGGGNLRIRDLAFQNGSANGILVPVPAEATGTVAVQLRNVSLNGNGLSGLLFDDQLHDSAASVRLDMVNTEVIGNGFKEGIDDFDGVRVNEGGSGSIKIYARSTVFAENAADGFEIDEKGDGDVRLTVSQSSFNNNGSQPQLPSDLEDGLDIDEAGAGSIYARLFNVQANDNHDEGIDFDEEGPGDLIGLLSQVQANRNADEGIKFTEDKDAEPELDEINPAAAGMVSATLLDVQANENGKEGIQLEEFGPGSLRAYLWAVQANNNEDNGFEASEGSDDYDESVADAQNAGNLRVMIAHSEFLGNEKDSVKVKQFGPGRGWLKTFFVDSDSVDVNDGVEVFEF